MDTTVGFTKKSQGPSKFVAAFRLILIKFKFFSKMIWYSTKFNCVWVEEPVFTRCNNKLTSNSRDNVVLAFQNKV